MDRGRAIGQPRTGGSPAQPISTSIQFAIYMAIAGGADERFVVRMNQAMRGTRRESSHSRRWQRYEVERRNGLKAEADGGNRRSTYTLAHNEDLLFTRI